MAGKPVIEGENTGDNAGRYRDENEYTGAPRTHCAEALPEHG